MSLGMNMTKVAIITAVISIVAIIAVAYRGCVVLPYPLGSGQYAKSPDGRYEAYAANMTDKYFWGGRREYYEFQIKDVQSRSTLRTIRMTPPDREEIVDYYGNTILTWASNSSAVTIPVGRKMDLTITP